MTYDPENPFAEFDESFKGVAPAKPGSIGRLPEFANYKGVCTTVDLEGDGVLVDKEIFETKTGTKGLKIFLEILWPEKVGDVTVKGEIHEHTFFVTDGMLPYIKRDASIILGRPVETMPQFAKEKWAGATVEFGLRDDTYQGLTRSKVSYFNAWKPGDEKADPKNGAADQKKGASGAAADPKKKADQKKGAAAGAKPVDF
jgi:hypothetical protein